MIVARNIHLTRGGRRALHAVDIRVGPGEVVVVLGANGAGKSSLLSVMTGELKPEKGEVIYDNRALSEIPFAERARLRGVLVQDLSMSFAYRVLDVVLMGLQRSDCGEGREDQILEQAAKLMCEVEVLHLAERPINELSGGERQRVHLARVLGQISSVDSQEGRYLFLDEPTSSLDLANQHRVLNLVKVRAAQGIGALAILHDPNLAAMYADRIFLLDEGRIRDSGSPDRVMTADAISRLYGLPVETLRHPQRDCPLIYAR